VGEWTKGSDLAVRGGGRPSTWPDPDAKHGNRVVVCGISERGPRRGMSGRGRSPSNGRERGGPEERRGGRETTRRRSAARGRATAVGFNDRVKIWAAPALRHAVTVKTDVNSGG